MKNEILQSHVDEMNDNTLLYFVAECTLQIYVLFIEFTYIHTHTLLLTMVY